MGDGRWEMGDGRWEMGDGRWEMGDGRGEMGDGRWEMHTIYCKKPKGMVLVERRKHGGDNNIKMDVNLI